MNNRTFCVLLAAFLMAVCGIVRMCRDGERSDEPISGMAVEAATEQNGWLAPLDRWLVLEAYGAQYNEQLGQWSGRDSILLDAETGDVVSSPTDGIIERVEQVGDGSLIVVSDENMSIEIWEVTGVCIFEGSRVEAGDVLGRAHGPIGLRMYKNGEYTDPETWLSPTA